MLSLVRISLVLVPLLLGLLLSAAIPRQEWLLSRSKWNDGVNNGQSADVQRFDEENKVLSPDVQRFDEESEQNPEVQRFDEASLNTKHSSAVQRLDEDSVNNEPNLDEQRFDEKSYSSPNKVQAEVDQIAEVLANEPNSEELLPKILRRQYPDRPQCRYAGCGK